MAGNHKFDGKLEAAISKSTEGNTSEDIV